MLKTKPLHLLAGLMLLLALPRLATAFDWNYRVGEEAPAFSLKTLDGKKISSTDLRGHYAVLSFMTSWCPFCNAAAPNLELISHDYAARGVEVVVIDIDEANKPVSKFVKKHGLTFPVAMDHGSKVAVSYAPPSEFVPDLKRDEVMIASFMIIAPDGRIQFLSLNEDTAKFDAKLGKLRSKLDELLAAK